MMERICSLRREPKVTPACDTVTASPVHTQLASRGRSSEHLLVSGRTLATGTRHKTAQRVCPGAAEVADVSIRKQPRGTGANRHQRQGCFHSSLAGLEDSGAKGKESFQKENPAIPPPPPLG
ncbi:hypothetical protein CB1_000662008 [Camelus ferus]|nr:hypothetical protein CB1_000662008 [Camelus ferus]